MKFIVSLAQNKRTLMQYTKKFWHRYKIMIHTLLHLSILSYVHTSVYWSNQRGGDFYLHGNVLLVNSIAPGKRCLTAHFYNWIIIYQSQNTLFATLLLTDVRLKLGEAEKVQFDPKDGLSGGPGAILSTISMMSITSLTSMFGAIKTQVSLLSSQLGTKKNC